MCSVRNLGIDRVLGEFDEEYCRCGRRTDRRHCPKCGYGTFTTLARPAIINDKEVLQYKCRRCMLVYTDEMWTNCCAAPELPETVAQKKEQKNKILRKELMTKAESGVNFSHNDKLQFKRLVGVSFDEYLQFYRQTIARAQKHKQEMGG